MDDAVWKMSLDAWVPRAFPRDSKAIARWFEVTASLKGDSNERLCQRVVGWDDSKPPSWVQASETDRVLTIVEERDTDWVFKMLEDHARRRKRPSSSVEIRRIEAPVTDWYGRTCAKTFSLRLPLVVYELWGAQDERAAAHAVWTALTEPQRDAAGLDGALAPFLGSTVIILPQRRPYFVDVSNIVLPGAWPDLLLVSEVLDGATVLARAAAPLSIVPRPPHASDHPARYLNVHEVGPSFAAANELEVRDVETVSPFPEDAHGHSGSDWRVTIVGEGVCDAAMVGLIRGIGNGYLTREPWLQRSPDLGFSAPARVTHVPPSSNAGDAAFKDLLRAGGPVAICDPYAEPASLARLAGILQGGRLVTQRKAIKADGVTEAWANGVGLAVRVASSLHDRFVIGSRRSFLVGYSLNGLGKKHSFMIELDAIMRLRGSTVFEEIWSASQPAW